jgi:hypothetical protein
VHPPPRVLLQTLRVGSSFVELERRWPSAHFELVKVVRGIFIKSDRCYVLRRTFVPVEWLSNNAEAYMAKNAVETATALGL